LCDDSQGDFLVCQTKTFIIQSKDLQIPYWTTDQEDPNQRKKGNRPYLCMPKEFEPLIGLWVTSYYHGSNTFLHHISLLNSLLLMLFDLSTGSEPPVAVVVVLLGSSYLELNSLLSVTSFKYATVLCPLPLSTKTPTTA
jgi:hypothetical protein